MDDEAWESGTPSWNKKNISDNPFLQKEESEFGDLSSRAILKRDVPKINILSSKEKEEKLVDELSKPVEMNTLNRGPTFAYICSEEEDYSKDPIHIHNSIKIEEDVSQDPPQLKSQRSLHKIEYVKAKCCCCYINKKKKQLDVTQMRTREKWRKLLRRISLAVRVINILKNAKNKADQMYGANHNLQSELTRNNTLQGADESRCVLYIYIYIYIYKYIDYTS